MSDVVIVGATRTAVGAFNGAFASVPADVLGATVIQEVLARAKVDAAEVSEVVLGQVLTAGQGQNPARQAAINAGVPKEMPAYGVNILCGSGCGRWPWATRRSRPATGGSWSPAARRASA